MSESGFSTVTGLTSIGAVAMLASLSLMSADGQVAAADETACRFDKTVVLKAIEAKRATTPGFAYPAPSGPDGLDEVRSSGWLRTESAYWRYGGFDGNQPVLVLRKPAGGCS